MARIPREAPADLRLVESISISTLDPASVSHLQDIRVLIQILEGLMVFDPSRPDPVPGCAASVDVDSGGRRYRYRLRAEARWSNGDPVIADDFLFAWRRAIEPGTRQDYAFFLDFVAGVPEYVAWRHAEISRIGELPGASRRAACDAHLAEADRRFGATVGLAAPSPDIVEIRLSRPVPYWLDLMSNPVFLPLNRRAVEPYRRISDTGLIYYEPGWSRPGRMVCNGPYMLADWRFKRSVRLARNPHYRDAGPAAPRSVEILDVADPNTAWLMYAAGRVDWLPSLDAGFVPELLARSDSPFPIALNRGADRPRRDIHAFPCFGTYFYSFNCLPTRPDGSANPFHDARVRRAFVLAVDAEAVCRSVLRQNEIPAESFIPPDSIAGYPRVAGLAFDPIEARRLLAEAGFAEPRRLPETVISFNNEANHALIAQTVAAMLRANLGVRVRIEGKEGQTFADDKQRHRFHIARASWYGDYSDPTTFLDTLATGNGNNDSGYSDPEYDALLDAAGRAADEGERMRILARAEARIVTETLPILPLFHYVNVYAFDPQRVRGLAPNVRLLIPYKDLEVRR